MLDGSPEHKEAGRSMPRPAVTSFSWFQGQLVNALSVLREVTDSAPASRAERESTEPEVRSARELTEPGVHSAYSDPSFFQGLQAYW